MPQKKQNDYFDFPSKVLSLPHSRTNLMNPFRTDIHHLLATYFQFSYYLAIFPYRFSYEKAAGQYELHSNIVQKKLYYLLWLVNLLSFAIQLERLVKASKGPIDILNVLGASGHFFTMFSFLATIHYYKERIKNLLNFFVTFSAPSSPRSSRTFIRSTSTVKTLSYPKEFRALKTSEERINECPGAWVALKSRCRIIFSFRNIGVICWLYALLQGIQITGLLNAWISHGTIPLTNTKHSVLYIALHAIFPDLERGLPTPLLYVLEGIYVFILLGEVLRRFIVAFMYVLGIAIALTAKSISSHITSTVFNSRDHWKPSSSNVLHNILMVRQSYRMMSQIFGWFLQQLLMYEFPNMTFYVVYSYLNPEQNLQWSFKACLINEMILLSVATWAAQEMSEIKELLFFEEKRHWSLTKNGSLQRRIVMFELSLDKYTLSAHGFFQLSLPAFVSIVSALLSNALILIQLALSS